MDKDLPASDATVSSLIRAVSTHIHPLSTGSPSGITAVLSILATGLPLSGGRPLHCYVREKGRREGNRGETDRQTEEEREREREREGGGGGIRRNRETEGDRETQW